LVWFLVTDPVKLLAYRVLGANQSVPAPLAKAGSKPDAEAAPKSAAQPDAKVESKPETEVQPRPEAHDEPKPAGKAEPEAAASTATKPDAEPEPNTGVAALLNRTLGDLLLAGLVKDPEDAGRIIAAAIAQAGAPIAAPKVPEADPKSETTAKTPPAPTRTLPSDHSEL
jgi:hypothetical protein